MTAAPQGVATGPGPGAAATPHDLRRLDWRFLLPDLSNETHRDAVIHGSAAARLAPLAAQFGLARRVLPAAQAAGHPSDVDLLAVFGDAPLSPASVPALAARSLRPRGQLYWEVDRRRAVSLTPRRALRALRARGLTPAGLYWVKPDFEHAEMYLPLDVAHALRWYFKTLYTAITPARRALEHAVGLLTGLHPRRFAVVAPCYAIVAVAHTGQHRPAVLALPAAAPAVGDAGRAVMLTDAGERAVLLPFPARGAAPAGVVKVPKLPRLNRKTEEEQRALAHARGAVRAATLRHMPVPLGTAGWRGLALGLESCLPGQSMLASTGRWGAPLARKLSDLRLASDWLADFHLQTTTLRAPWDQRLAEQWVESPLRAYETRLPAPPAVERLFSLARERARALAAAPFRVVWRHRDFSVWNLYRARDQLGVIDWEGCGEGPAVCDLLYFLAHWCDTARGPRRPHDQRAAFVSLFARHPAAGPHPHRIERAAHAALRDYLTRLEIDPRFVPLLVTCTWTELALGRARRLEALAAPDAAAPTPGPAAEYLAALAGSAEDLFAAWS